MLVPRLSPLLRRVAVAQRARVGLACCAAFLLSAACNDTNAPTLTAPANPAFAASACTIGLTNAETLATINDLTAAINALEAAGTLNSGQANALRGHLQNVLKSVNAGNYCAAKSQLQAFKDQVGTFVAGGTLTPEQGGSLTGPATEIVEGVIRFSVIEPALSHTCGLSTDGVAYCWGANSVGQLGDGTTSSTPRLIPARVLTNLRFVAISGGGSHTCALTSDGVAYCWGYGGYGALGDGKNENRLIPTAVNTTLRFTSISAAGTGLFFGYESESALLPGGHTCALTASGQAYCWGYNHWGVFGDGTTDDQLVPSPVASGVTFRSISTWETHTCGVTTAGEAKCWGMNRHGELGDGTTTQRLSPVTVAGGFAFASAKAGWEHSCGITTAGAAYCWGLNGFGVLGDGTTTDRLVPTPVVSSETWSSISPGGWIETCGLSTTNVAYCWGANLNGVASGTGTNFPQHTPALVGPTLGLRFSSLRTGMERTCAVTTSNRGYCWGDNFFGQLGDGTRVDRNLPVAVKGAP